MKRQLQTNAGRGQLRIVEDRLDAVRENVHSQLRQFGLSLITGILNEEIAELCGPRYARKGDAQAVRAGSDPGSVFLHGQRVAVKKPRAKKDGRDVELLSYKVLQDFDVLSDRVTDHVLNGISTRNYDGLTEELVGGLGLKKTTVSKAFKRGSKKMLDELNGRDLSKYDFFSVMFDSVDVAGRAVVAALGITTDGDKFILGIREGNTESWEVCRDLFHNLVDRGFRSDHPILFVIDGAKALKKAIRKLFGNVAPVQRCIRHKERNVLQYLPDAHHKEFRRRWKKIHGMTDIDDAAKELAACVRWLGEINLQAQVSLEEAEGETLTAIRLGASKLLRLTLLSTNPLESVFDNFRMKTVRVKNWRAGVDQALRWSAAALTDSEKRMRKIKGHKEIPLVVENLKKLDLQTKLEVA